MTFDLIMPVQHCPEDDGSFQRVIRRHMLNISETLPLSLPYCVIDWNIPIK